MSRSSVPTELEEMALRIVQSMGEVHGVAVAAALCRAERPVTVSSVYRVLGRLRDAELLESQIAGKTGKRGGKAKRLYSLTPLGVEELARADARKAAVC